MDGAVDKEKLAKLQRMAAGVRVGGKGSVRRKKKAVHKAAPTDDKRLQTTLKRLQLSPLPGIEEVNIFKDNGSVINFQNPKVQAQISANTYVISGNAVTKPLQEMLPSIVNQLGADNMPQMKSLMDQLGAGMSGGKPETAAQAGTGVDVIDDDDEIPDLVENVTFEDKAVGEEKIDDKDNNDEDDTGKTDGTDNMPQIKSVADQLGAGMSGDKPETPEQVGKDLDDGDASNETPGLVENRTVTDKAVGVEKIDDKDHEDEADTDEKDEIDNKDDVETKA